MNSKKVVIFVVSIFVLLCSEALSKEISVESLLPKKLPEGWRQIGSPQVYNQKTLFNRINGQAELFLKYGFQKSVFTVYQNKNNSKDQIELDLYDMGNVLQAFGIFSRFRSEDRSAGVGLESYVEETSLLFYKGRYFVMLYATEVDPSLLKSMAMTISSSIPDSTPAPKELIYFPKDGLRPGSIEYHPEGLLGYQFFKRGFQGIYIEKVKAEVKVKDDVQEKEKSKVAAKGEIDEKENYLFLAIFKNSEEAISSLRIYRDYLSRKEKRHSEIPPQFGSNGLGGEDPNRGKVIIVAKGFYLAGITGFDSVGHAEKLLEEFVKNIH
jgi:hypothetical protein